MGQLDDASGDVRCVGYGGGDQDKLLDPLLRGRTDSREATRQHHYRITIHLSHIAATGALL